MGTRVDTASLTSYTPREARDERVYLKESRTWTGFEAAPFREALSCSLELLGSEPLKQGVDRPKGNPA